MSNEKENKLHNDVSQKICGSMKRNVISAVRQQYESLPFPADSFMSKEGLLLLRYLKEWLDNGDTQTGKNYRVIDVGCGTGNTTIALARIFPHVQFLGVDLSRKSLQRARQLQENKNLNNVDFQHLDLQSNVSNLGKFNVVLCTGVLHHLADIPSAFRQIARLVEHKGYVLVWLYGRYGRTQHQLNQLFLNLITKSIHSSKRLDVAKDFVEQLGTRFVKNSGFYTPQGSGEAGIQWMLSRPAWLADQMIPGYKQGVSLKEILALFHQNNIEFVQWLGVPHNLESFTASKMLINAFNKLPREDRMIAMDYLLKPEYYFIAGQKTALKRNR